jgi:hypothetical protein
MTDLSRIAELANRLAARTLARLHQREMTLEEFNESLDVALVLKTANLLGTTGAELPRGVLLLALKAAEQSRR